MRFEYLPFFKNVDSLKHSIYYFCGPEPFLKRRAKERLLERKDFAGYSKSRWQAPSLDLGALWEQMSGGGLFSSGEIIMIDRAEKLSAANKKGFLELIDRWEQENIDGKILILSSDAERVDAADPLEGRMIAGSQSCHVFLPLLQISEVMLWARGELKRRGIEAEGALLEWTADVLLNDLNAWHNFVTSLDLSLGKSRQASLEQAKSLLEGVTIDEERYFKEIENEVLEFLSLDGGQEESLKRALDSLEKLLEQSAQGGPAVAMRLLRVFADWIYELGAAKSGSYSSRRKRNPALNQRLMSVIKRWSWNEVIALYDFVVEAERQIKTGESPAETVIRRLILNVSQYCEKLSSGRRSGTAA